MLNLLSLSLEVFNSGSFSNTSNATELTLFDEIALIALTAAATFSILDTYIPSMGATARSGAGFGIGANLVRFPGGF